LKPNRAEREAVRTVEAQRTHGDQVENAYFGVGIPHDTPWLVVTEGPSGCVLSGKDSLHPPRSLPVRFRTSGDPTGCGDTFMAAMVATWCRCLTIFGQNDERALEAGCRVGNAAAACVMDHVGAHIVTPAEVSAELATFDYGMTNDDRSAPQQGGPKT
jgi:bifunctional ADP-heptose synthase (sugar kinase/adenylyltransferase)